ncbi:MAG TPA: hypothetical protein PK926_11710 [Spirochaetota bacterium]|nr:hypothetical protein [Spirochaetota bacterium]HPI89034.1 hypothetical protein [Spirochaetota bacterium]HPR48673.1 hypothetical protein [Spirochaetota bacterium]
MGRKKISLETIDLSDETYRISRPARDDRLMLSIRQNGIIDHPELLEIPGGHIILKGHNRVKCACDLGWDSIEATVTDSFNRDDFLKHALLKEYHRAIGPAGKARLYLVLQKHHPGPARDLMQLCRKGFSIPESFAHTGLAAFILSLPRPLLDYCDARDISFRVLEKMRSLPGIAVNMLAEWTSSGVFKVNLFKSIVDMLDDIVRRDGNAAVSGNIDIGQAGMNGIDAYVHEQIFIHRYPEYSRLQQKADRSIRLFSASGIRVDIPKNFEGSKLEITIPVDARDGLEKIMDKISLLDREGVGRLLRLLDQ